MTDHLELRSKIEAEYVRGGYKQGWGFLNSPKATLNEADTAFLGLNPGGTNYLDGYFSEEKGSAYLHQRWEGMSHEGEHPLQRQVLAVFKALNVRPDSVLSGNILPFSTKEWKDVNNTGEALRFADRLWRPILTSRPMCIVVMGRDAERLLLRMLGGDLYASVDTGWGRYKARFYSYSAGKICALPHLSRFKIFNRGRTEELELALREMRESFDREN